MIAQFSVLIWMKRLMPPGKRQSQDVFFVAAALCALVFLLPIMGVMMWQGVRTCASSCAIAWCLVALSLVLWRCNMPALVPVLVFECTLLSLIMFNVMLFGGVVSPVLIWFGFVPLLSFYITRRIWCYAFLAFSLCLVSVVFVLQLNGYIASPPGTSVAQIWSSWLMYSLFVLAQILLVMLVDAKNLMRLRRAGHNNKRLRGLTYSLEQANAHKDRFLLTVSHEMRTPLNAVHGFLELLCKRHDLPPVVATQIGHAASSAAHLLTIINDLLDYSQIRQGCFSLAMQQMDLPQLLHETHQILQEQAARKGLRYTWKATTALPRWVQVDPDRLAQILLNLLGNAIKFTHRGEIRLEVGYHAKNAQQGELELCVMDTGIGIPATQLEHIFEPFVQLAPTAAVNACAVQHGNGLGLAITRSLIQACGGQISAHNRPEGGSLFRGRLPIQTAQSEVDTTHSDPINRPATRTRAYDFLLVDDHAMNRLVARAVIEQAFPASRIDEAQNGEQALKKMAMHLYDLVLMDIVMHDINGIDVVHTVRNTYPEPYRKVPVIALTANLATDIVARCEACGIAAIVPKPFKADMLIQAIEKHVRQAGDCA